MNKVNKPVYKIDYNELDELVNQFLCNEEKDYLEYLIILDGEFRNGMYKIYELWDGEKDKYSIYNYETKKHEILSNNQILDILTQLKIDDSVLSHIIKKNDEREIYDMAMYYMISTGTLIPKDCCLIIDISW